MEATPVEVERLCVKPGQTCPLCMRRVPKPKRKASKLSIFEQFWREAFVCFAFSQPWPFSPLAWKAREGGFVPIVMRLRATGGEQTVSDMRREQIVPISATEAEDLSGVETA